MLSPSLDVVLCFADDPALGDGAEQFCASLAKYKCSSTMWPGSKMRGVGCSSW